MIGFWRNRLYQLPCCSFFHHKRSTAPNIKPEFICTSQRAEIAHRRKLTLEFASGEKLVVKFDQGVGYWKIKEAGSRFDTVRFDFRSQIAEQLGELKRLETNLVVNNSEVWSTDITYKQM